MITLHRHFRIALCLGALVALCDQLSKWILINNVMRPPHVVEVTPFLNLVLVYNKGVTFGLLNNLDHHVMPMVLIGVAAVIIFLLVRWLWLTHSMPVAVGLGLVMGGAVGNVIDRIREGAVVDFLDFYYQNYHWFAFNIADAAIVTGVGLLMIDSVVKAR